MAARATGHGLKQTPARDSSLPEDNESENPPEEERRESRAQNYCGFSLQGIFRLALTFFKGNPFLLDRWDIALVL